MITVMLFAGLKERAGKDRFVFQETEMTVKTIKKRLIQEIDGITHLEGALVAINENYANDSSIVKAQDAVAIIPPVSGG